MQCEVCGKDAECRVCPACGVVACLDCLFWTAGPCVYCDGYGDLYREPQEVEG